jgi:uncharacterized protein YqeY
LFYLFSSGNKETHFCRAERKFQQPIQLGLPDASREGCISLLQTALQKASAKHKLQSIRLPIFGLKIQRINMALKEKIDAAIKAAMLAKQQNRLLALRSIKSLILLEETKEGGSGGLSEDSEMKILNKAAKQRRDSLDIYRQQGRADLAEKEEAELSVIEEFLPKQLSPEELEDKVRVMVQQAGAVGPQDMGKVMGIASKALAGLADGKSISETVKRILAGS